MEITGLLTYLLGLLIGVIGYFVKRSFDKLDANAKAIEEIKLNCMNCSNKASEELIRRMSEMIDQKLEAWWAKIENGLMNEGRLPPRVRKKE